MAELFSLLPCGRAEKIYLRCEFEVSTAYIRNIEGFAVVCEVANMLVNGADVVTIKTDP